MMWSWSVNISGNRAAYLFAGIVGGGVAKSADQNAFAPKTRQEEEAPAKPAEGQPHRAGSYQTSVLMLANLLSVTPERRDGEGGSLGSRVGHLSLRTDSAKSWDSLPGDPMRAAATPSQIAAQIIRDLGGVDYLSVEDAQRALAGPESGVDDSVRTLIGRYVDAHDTDRSGTLGVSELRDLIEKVKAKGAPPPASGSHTVTV